MMELLVVHGADVNALWHGHFPIVFAPCESLDPRGDAVRRLRPNARSFGGPSDRATVTLLRESGAAE